MQQSFERPEQDARRTADGAREAELRAAQRHSTYTIDGAPRERVRCGAEPEDPIERCDDCGARAGQFHVPGCSVERCPVCAGHVVACDCWYGQPTPT